MKVQIIYADEKYFRSFYETLQSVAKERVYIEMIEAPAFERVSGFQSALIQKRGPIFYAIDGARVVGWCDIFPEENPRLSHRGHLGMGLLPEYRGKGIGLELLKAVLGSAKAFGLEKVELNVYTSNLAAIALYKKVGFEQEGLIKRYRKLDGIYFDCLAMGLFL